MWAHSSAWEVTQPKQEQEWEMPQVCRGAGAIQGLRSGMGRTSGRSFTNQHPQPHPVVELMEENELLEQFRWWSSIWENTWGRRQMQALPKWEQPALEQQDGSWWHVWQEREQAPLTAAILQSAFHLLDLNTKVTWKMVTKFFFCKVLPFN